MIESLVLVGSGVAVISAIGASKLREHIDRRKMDKLQLRIDFLTDRCTRLKGQLDAAQRAERDARTRQYLAERDLLRLEDREKQWTKERMAMMPGSSGVEDWDTERQA